MKTKNFALAFFSMIFLVGLLGFVSANFYVSNYNTNTISNVSYSSVSGNSSSTGAYPHAVVLCGGAMWTPNYNGNSISKWNLSSGALTTYGGGMTHMRDIACDPTTNHTWTIAGQYGGQEWYANGSLVGNFTTNGFYTGIAYNGVDRMGMSTANASTGLGAYLETVFTSNRSVSKLLSKDGATGTNDITWCDGAWWLAGGNYATVSKVNATTYAVTNYTGTGLGDAWITCDPDHHAVWTTNSYNDSATRLWTANGSATNVTGLGTYPYGAAYDPNTAGGIIATSNRNSATVSFIYATNATLIKTIGGTGGGHGIAWDGATLPLSAASDTTAPTSSLNSTNSTYAGQFIRHDLYWTDDTALSGYIFSFDNGTGAFVNDSFVALSGASAWSNVTKLANFTGGTTIQWKVYANDSSGNLNVSKTFSYATTILDLTAPTWSANQTNSTIRGTFIKHSVLLADDVALAGYTFSFDNGTGTFANDSFVTLSGLSAWANVTKLVNFTSGSPIRWEVYFNDSSGNLNLTSAFAYSTTNAAPQISFDSSTIPDNSNISYSWIFVNVSATDASLANVTLDFNGINETFANNSGPNYWENKTGLADGTYNFSAFANNTGGTGNSTATRTVIIDATAPNLTTSINNGDSFGRNQFESSISKTLTYAGADAHPNILAYEIRFPNGSLMTANASANYTAGSIPLTLVTYGTYQWTINDTDTFNHTTQKVILFSLDLVSGGTAPSSGGGSSGGSATGGTVTTTTTNTTTNQTDSPINTTQNLNQPQDPPAQESSGFSLSSSNAVYLALLIILIVALVGGSRRK